MLNRDNCVIVPKLGAFISECEFSENENVMRKPIANVVFNPLINYDDSVLMHSLIRCGINKQEAENRICNFVSTIKTQLSAEGVVPIGRIGFLSLRDNVIQFKQFPNFFLSNKSYGLIDVRIPLISKGEKEKNSGVVIENEKWGNYKKAVFRVASLLVLVLLSVVLTTPKLADSDVAYANAQIVELKTCDEGSVEIEQDNLQLYVAKPIEQELTSADKKDKYLIISVLSTPEQVNVIKKEYGINRIFVLEHNDRFYVYIAKGEIEYLREIQSVYKDEFPNSWIL